MIGLVSATLALALAGQAPAQPPPPVEAPAEVCLSNACSSPLKAIAAPKTVREAIQAGQAFKVRDLGGSPRDAMDAILKRQVDRRAAMPKEQWGMIEELEANLKTFADTSDGSTLRYTSNTDFPASAGQVIVGAIERRGADGSVQNFWLTDNGGGIYVRPGYEPPRTPRT